MGKRGTIESRRSEHAIATDLPWQHGRARVEGREAVPGRYSGGAYREGADAPRDESGSGSSALDPNALQAVLTQLLVDPEMNREMQINPKRAIERTAFLEPHQKNGLLTVPSERMEALAAAASKYAKSVKQIAGKTIGPAGFSSQYRPGSKGWKGPEIGGEDGGGGGGLGDLSEWMNFGKRGPWSQIPGMKAPSGEGGNKGAGSGDTGGLSRGMWQGFGLGGGLGRAGGAGDPRVGFGPNRGGPDFDVTSLGVGVPGDSRRDPLVASRARRVISPGGDVMEKPNPGSTGEDNRKHGIRPDPAVEKKKTENEEEIEKNNEIIGNILAGAIMGAGAGAVIGGSIGAAGGPTAVPGAVAGAWFGAWAGAAVAVVGMGARKHWWMPADDGSGPVGPRSREMMPADDGSGPTGPWARGSLQSRKTLEGELYMPAPDDPNPGGPWGRIYLPNPDDAGPGTPWSNISHMTVDIATAIRSVMFGGKP